MPVSLDSLYFSNLLFQEDSNAFKETSVSKELRPELRRSTAPAAKVVSPNTRF